ncbi:RHS repeat domain-containing protein [Chitinophaga sancti]|uniref:YD repeat-containing protein n=1 Tax=Chitinophaga sancti TaxID=1004 RepID=A0A1K1LRY9_9BACT|nr:hypothetical protein [Chitinophaga sancti]WQD64891.1 hypothetical protein U0033_10835 [Chitinophaga sancti]WQG89485.1 hypothetical protein SR876_31635 [Chitinophaga sancti]SFW13644.1 hypothetical protein SAMN05661012_00173 [Chitinophaga sancti]
MYTRKTLFAIAIFLVLYTGAQAQFYYLDILNTKQTEENQANYKNAKVVSQIVASFDAEGRKTDYDFRSERDFSDNYRQLLTVTASVATGRSIMRTYFNNKGHLTKIIDSTRSIITTTIYTYDKYDSSHNIKEIYVKTEDPGNKYTISETRRYVYDSLNRPTRMIHFRGEKLGDSTTVKFVLDSAGHVVEEQETGKGKIYYKYNDQGLLTDIYRYYPSKQKMLPDYVFDYDAKNRIGATTTVNAQTRDYVIYRNTYNEMNLLEGQDVYGKQKVQVGVVRYKYKF